MILIGHNITELRKLPEKSVHCVVTSPPYWGLRAYGTDPQTWGDGWVGELGSEPTPEMFVAHMVEVFAEVWRVLRDDGTCWVNLGDSYAGAGYSNHKINGDEWYQSVNSDKRKDRQQKMKKACLAQGIKPKDLIGIPWRVAFALQAAGWYLRQDIIWCLSGGAWVYAKTAKGEMPVMVKDLVRLKPSTVKLWNGERWTQVLGWGRNPDPQDKTEIVLRSGERIGCTGTHLWPTQRGNVCASELVVGDVIQTCRLPEPESAQTPSHFHENAAWFLGLYLAEGSRADDTIQFSLCSDELHWVPRIESVAKHYGGSLTYTVSGNSLSVRAYGRLLVALVEEYIGGTVAKDKHLKVAAWKLPDSTLREIAHGYLQGDGNFDQANGRWRLGFTRNYSLERDLRTLSARLGACLTLVPCTSTSQNGEHKAFRGEWRWDRSGHWNEKDRGEIVEIRSSRARQFWDISVEDDPHLFSLASGVLTHNCKPNPMPESVRDRCTKAHEYLFLLTKSERYFFDGEAISEAAKGPAGGNTRPNKSYEYDPVKHRTKAGLAASQMKARENGGFESRNRRSVWSISTHSYKGAHFACVDVETEALTRSGWKRESDLKDGDSILAFNQATGCLEWQEATFHRYQFDGEMISIQKRDSSQLLTPNHRCLVRKRTKKGYATTVVEAANLNSRMDVVVSAPWADCSLVSIGEEFAELCGWYVTEGEKPRVGGSVRINQSVSANPGKVERIRALLVAVGAVFTEGVRTRHVQGRKSIECRFTVKGDVAKKLWETCFGKMIPEWSHELCEKDAVAMLRGVVDGDGHRRLNDGRSMIVQKNREAIERMQILAIRCGYRTILTKTARDNRLYLTTGRLLTLRGTNGAGPAYTKKRYAGVVWCPSVASGFWLARRDGKPFVTGNTYPPRLVEPCILAGTSAKGCCPHCGKPWVRVIESKRVPTRPGENTKVPGKNSRFFQERDSQHSGDYKADRYSLEVGNRDPQRHVSVKVTTGWQQACKCEAHEPVPCTVLDPFGGSGTTAIVAAHHGRKWIICELNPEYAALAEQRISEGWTPPKAKKPRRKRHVLDRQLF